MINTNKRDISVVYVHPKTGYYLPSNRALRKFLIEDHCSDCYKMSRVAMFCYAAVKHPSEKKGKSARTEPKEKPKSTKRANKYKEIETTVLLDKYNGKMMFSIWGLYNRNSPHNFKKQNAEDKSATKEGQELKTTETKFKSPLVQITIPKFGTGIVSFETNLEVKKPKTTMDKFENLFSFPIF